MNIELEPFSIDLRDPLETSAGRIERRQGVLVWLESGGLRGVGEATPLPGFTESHEDCLAALERARERSSVTDALATVEDTPAARHGIELAALDRRARRESMSLCTLLGVEGAGQPIPVNATIGTGTVAETRSRIEQAVSQGYTACKLKVGVGTLEADIERVSAARAAVGEAVELRVDANGAWTRETARRAIDELAALDVALLEQPLPPDSLDATRRLRDGGIDIALDESVVEHGIEAAADAADVLVIKPMALGGVHHALEAIQRTECDPIVTTTIDAAVARSAAVHLAGALECTRACGLGTADRLVEDVAPDPAPVTNGQIRVPGEPGLGIDHSEVCCSG